MASSNLGRIVAPILTLALMLIAVAGYAVPAQGAKKEGPERGKEGGLSTQTIEEIKKVRDEIRTEAEGEIIKYQEESFYSEDDFSAILENENEFKPQLIERFEQEIVEATAENCRVDLNKLRRSAMLKCDIKGARYSTNSYNMHFLLNGTRRFGFDLYGFEEHERKLVYDGKVNGVPTRIVFEFPYKIDHCHEHVWPD